MTQCRFCSAAKATAVSMTWPRADVVAQMGVKMDHEPPLAMYQLPTKEQKRIERQTSFRTESGQRENAKVAQKVLERRGGFDRERRRTSQIATMPRSWRMGRLFTPHDARGG